MYTDFGYMEEGKLGKPYDLKLMVRLGDVIRPYCGPDGPLTSLRFDHGGVGSPHSLL